MKAHIQPRLTGVEAAVAKAQWLMLVAINDTLGIGQERFRRVLARYTELVDEYQGLQRDAVADELLLRRVRQILPEVGELYFGDGRWRPKCQKR